MKHKYVFLIVILALVLAGGAFVWNDSRAKVTKEEEELQILSSFYPVYNGVTEITAGIPGLEITNLAPPTTGCLHDYQMTTDDMVRIGEADVFFVNGGGMEHFMEDVLAKYPDLQVVEAGAEFLKTHENNHVWLSIDGYQSQLEVITDTLAAIDPDHAADFNANLEGSKEKLEELQSEVDAIRAQTAGQKVVLLHEGFEYLAGMLDLDARAVLDLDEEVHLSAADLSALINQVKDEEIPYILCDAAHGKEVADTVARETNAVVLVIDPLTSGEYITDAYLTGMRKNLTDIAAVIGP